MGCKKAKISENCDLADLGQFSIRCSAPIVTDKFSASGEGGCSTWQKWQQLLPIYILGCPLKEKEYLQPQNVFVNNEDLLRNS